MTRPRSIRPPASSPTILTACVLSWTPSTSWRLTRDQPDRFRSGSPELRRLRVGRYRVLYEITEDVITVGRIARTPTSG